MKLTFRYTLFFLFLICLLFFATSCQEEYIPEDGWDRDYEEYLYNQFDIVQDVVIKDAPDSRSLSVYIVSKDAKREDIIPVFEDFYNYIFERNTELAEYIMESNPYISIVFHLKNDVVLKYTCHFPSKYKEKWSVFVNMEFESYYVYGEAPETESTPIKTK